MKREGKEGRRKDRRRGNKGRREGESKGRREGGSQGKREGGRKTETLPSREKFTYNGKQIMGLSSVLILVFPNKTSNLKIL